MKSLTAGSHVQITLTWTLHSHTVDARLWQATMKPSYIMAFSVQNTQTALCCDFPVVDCKICDVAWGLARVLQG